MTAGHTFLFGTPDQTLTGGLPLMRRSLYTTELQGQVKIVIPIVPGFPTAVNGKGRLPAAPLYQKFLIPLPDLTG